MQFALPKLHSSSGESVQFNEKVWSITVLNVKINRVWNLYSLI